MAETNKTTDLSKVADQMANLTVQQVNELATILKDKYNIQPEATPVFVPSTPAESDKPAEQTSFKVVLESVGPAKLKVIQAIRKLVDLDLKAAKGLTDNLPATIKEDVNKEEAENMKTLLEETGAQVNLK